MKSQSKNKTLLRNGFNHTELMAGTPDIACLEPRFSCFFPIYDALSCVLDSVHIQSTYLGKPVFNATAPWGIRIPLGPTSFNIIKQGRCWLCLNGKEPLLLNQGDMAVIIHGMSHCLRDDLQSETIPIEQILPPEQIGRLQNVTFGGGGKPATLVLGCFFLNPAHSRLLSALPDVIHIKNENGHPIEWLSGILNLLDNESTADHPGTSVLLNHLAHILFIQAVRSYLKIISPDNENWANILLSTEIHSALNLIHTYPEKAWSVTLLAKEISMSRSAFAAKFTGLLGVPPMKYLLDFRMHKASVLLQNNHQNLKQIALQVGYHSESAFSNAFKRWANIAPGLYRESRMQENASG